MAGVIYTAPRIYQRNMGICNTLFPGDVVSAYIDLSPRVGRSRLPRHLHVGASYLGMPPSACLVPDLSDFLLLQGFSFARAVAETV